MKNVKSNWDPESLYLYVVVRQDLDSMGRGRAASQVAHSANQMVYEHYIKDTATEVSRKFVSDWMNQTPYGFGTQITKKVKTAGDLEDLLSKLSSQNYGDLPVVFGITIDPEYYVPDGEAGHMVKNVPTALYCLLPRDHKITEALIRPIELLDNDPPVR